jgi:hypothetical protein
LQGKQEENNRLVLLINALAQQNLIRARKLVSLPIEGGGSRGAPESLTGRGILLIETFFFLKLTVWWNPRGLSLLFSLYVIVEDSVLFFLGFI